MKSKTPSKKIQFRLAISNDKYIAYYQGHARNVIVQSLDNRTVKFPASAIRQFLTHDGIYGLFEIHFDGNNKLIEIKQISQ